MSSTRRQFLRDASLTVTGAALVSTLHASKENNKLSPVVSCGPQRIAELTGTIASVQSGPWSDPATWGGRIPATSDTPLIQSGHTIIYDMETTTVAGLNVGNGGMLAFDAGKTTLLQSTANIVVEGLLQMKPASVAVLQTIRFLGINEDRYAGGGMNVLDTDIGLWVMVGGRLDLAGSNKTSWTRVMGSLAAGIGSITVENADGWQPGDEISIAPTEPPTVGAAFATGFDQHTIKSVSGNTIMLNGTMGRAHPLVNNQWTAEVMNLTRNVRIEGTAAGHAHIFIRSTAIQSIQNIAIRYMGPRKDRNGDGVKELVAGRYGMHFHHCMDGCRGSQVLGNVIRDTDNHSYVPHVSHGITFRDNIAYNVTEIAFWWDPGDLTHDTLYDHNIVAICKFVPGSLNMNAEDAPTFSSSGFLMTTGDDNICKNCVVVGGAVGDVAEGGGFNWEASLNEGVWTFIDCLSHNNDNGLRVWQNSTKNHVIENFTAYHNATAIFHGAYANSYTYNGGILYGNGITIKAASANTNRVRIENITIDGANIIDYGIEVIHSPLPGDKPIFVRGVTIRNCRTAAVHDVAEPEVHSTDLVQCNITGPIVLSQVSAPGETIRVQPVSGSPYQLTHSGKSEITVFAPTIWGNGKGLKAEYFNSLDFTKPAFTRIDSNVSFTEWSTGVHHTITGSTYSVRWTGKIMPQYSESYTFYLGSGGAHRLWIDNKLILDSWEEHYPDVYQATPITLEAGKLYDIKLEYYNKDGGTGMGLFWKCNSLPLEYVPQSQLYAEAISVQPPPPGNQAPIANAGPDVTLTLPVNSTTLDGKASADADGSIASYLWTKLSGPAEGTINSPAAVSTSVSNLVEGVYMFRLTVTDNKGATGQDDVMVTVNKKPADPNNNNDSTNNNNNNPGNDPSNRTPVANAGSDVTITQPFHSVTLNGGQSYDPDGSIVAYKWTLVSGPGQYNMRSSTASVISISDLIAGMYIFRLQVIDDKGASTTDDVTVQVNPAKTPDEVKPLTVTVMPNPTNSVFRIKVNSSSNLPITMRIYESNGKLVRQFPNVANGSTVIAGYGFARGTYMAVIDQGRQRKIVNLVRL